MGFGVWGMVDYTTVCVDCTMVYIPSCLVDYLKFEGLKGGWKGGDE